MIMRARVARVAYLGMFAGAAALALASPASSFTLNDNYFGAINNYNGGDVIEDPNVHTFEISSADVTRTNNGNTLKVVINTMFAGAPAAGTSDGTTYGSLFFTSAAAWNGAVVGPAPYSSDSFHAGLWTSAFVMNGNLNGTTGNGGLYSIGSTQTAVYYNNNNANPAVKYTTKTGSTAKGDIIMSNVNGNPISAPTSGNPGFYFRQDQAVQFNPNDPSAHSDIGSSWTIDAAGHMITYLINDNGSLGDGFAISWAMTCANDIIQGVIPPLGGGGQGSTPLPAAFPLFVSGLGVMGFFGSRRKRRVLQAAA